jgi:inward rectifier potassium channel
LIRKRKNSSEEEPRDLGFGNTVTGRVTRLLNRDGTFNVRRLGLPFLETLNLYHWLINMSWFRFNLIVIFSYAFINTFFAGIYYLIGVEHLAGIHGSGEAEKFWDAFFFSAQTLTTVGYGRISPVGYFTSFVAAIESMAGLLGFALATGLLYGRFSRPVARIMMSRHMLVAPYHGISSLQFRVANAHNNQLIDVDVQVVLSKVEMTSGSPMRKFYVLDLERKTINFLSLSWTIVHPINENSPFYGLSRRDLEDSDAEFMILIKAFDDTFSQTVHARSSYKHQEIIWGARFVPMFTSGKKGKTDLHLNLLDQYAPAELPVTEKPPEN